MNAIAEAIRIAVGDGGYAPGQVNRAAGDLPQTMRKLLAAEDLDRESNGHSSWRPNLRALAEPTGAMLGSDRPVDAGVLNRLRPKPPQRICDLDDAESLLNWQVLATAVANWCERHRRRLDLDHPLSGDPDRWPVMRVLTAELGKCHMTPEDLFGDYTCEPQFHFAYLPLYNIDCDEDYVPVVVFLDEQVEQAVRTEMITLPEIARQTAADHGFESADMLRIETVFCNLLLSDRLRLLNSRWRNAIRAVRAFPWNITFYEYESVAWDMTEPGEALDGLLEVCRGVDTVTSAVNRLLRGVCNDPAAFWWDLVNQCDIAGQRHPELEAPVQVKREFQKVRVGV